MTQRDLDRLAGVHPDLVAKLGQLFEQFPLFVVFGLRTAGQQAALWAKGRTLPGTIVTNCDGLHTKSNHQAHPDGLGHAADIAFQGDDPFGSTHPWAAMGAAANALGLVWGGDFKLVDLDHVELP